MLAGRQPIKVAGVTGTAQLGNVHFDPGLPKPTGGDQVGNIKLMAISVFLILTTPASTHAVTRAAYVAGLQPWRKSEGDK